MNFALNQQNASEHYKQLNKVKISSSGIYLPGRKVFTDDLMSSFDCDSRYGIPTNAISQGVGIIEKRVCDESEQPSDIAIMAAKQALDSSHTNRVDKLVFCGITKDHEEPATAHRINSLLGLKAKDCYDITDACFGFIRGLKDCINSIKLGECESALVVTGEIPSRVIEKLILKLKKGVSVNEARRAIGFITAGDAGGAILLTSCSPHYDSGFGEFHTISNSDLWDKCHYKIDGGEFQGQMMMGHLTAHGTKLGQTLTNSVMSLDGWAEPDIMLSHNTGDGSFDRLVGFGLASRRKWFSTYKNLGNLMSATFPVNYHMRVAKEKQGVKSGCLFNGSGLVFGYFDYTT